MGIYGWHHGFHVDWPAFVYDRLKRAWGWIEMKIQPECLCDVQARPIERAGRWRTRRA